LDYFNNAINNFSRPASSIPQEAYGLVCRSDPALRFHQKYLNSCSEDEWRSYGIGNTWGWVL